MAAKCLKSKQLRGSQFGFAVRDALLTPLDEILLRRGRCEDPIAIGERVLRIFARAIARLSGIGTDIEQSGTLRIEFAATQRLVARGPAMARSSDPRTARRSSVNEPAASGRLKASGHKPMW